MAKTTRDRDSFGEEGSPDVLQPGCDVCEHLGLPDGSCAVCVDDDRARAPAVMAEQGRRRAPRPGEGRPFVGGRVDCRYPVELIRRFDAAAAAAGLTRAQWLRRAAEAALDRPEG